MLYQIVAQRSHNNLVPFFTLIICFLWVLQCLKVKLFEILTENLHILNNYEYANEINVIMFLSLTLIDMKLLFYIVGFKKPLVAMETAKFDPFLVTKFP